MKQSCRPIGTNKNENLIPPTPPLVKGGSGDFRTKKRDLITVNDLSSQEIKSIFKKARYLKERQKKGEREESLKGKTVGLLFEKTSTRTRVSFEVGIYQLGGHPIFLSSEKTQMYRGETVPDTAMVLSRYMDGLIIRTFAHKTLEEWADHSSIPVINGLTDIHHPFQAISDLFTIFEKKGRFSGLKLAYIGDGNNVANSLIEASVKVGLDIALACPEGYEPDKNVMQDALYAAQKKGVKLELIRDPCKAVKGADIVYTDVWVSMGQEEESARRRKVFAGYQINRKLVEYGNPDMMIMHCMPVHRGEEITDEIINSKNSVIFDQAENRLHVQKAVLEKLIPQSI
ncbi:MAG: ornithine carbamoyltransferase [Nitrospirota bacterium]